MYSWLWEKAQNNMGLADETLCLSLRFQAEITITRDCRQRRHVRGRERERETERETTGEEQEKEVSTLESLI